MDFEATPPLPGPPPNSAPVTNDEAIDAAVAGLDGLDQLPLADHVDRFDTVHIALTAALASIDKV